MKNQMQKTLRENWDEEIADNIRMFYEADRLDDMAYEIIGRGDCDSHVWQLYTEAKNRADTKRSEAFARWLSIRQAMRHS